MQIIRYDDAAAFQSRSDSYLERNEATNSLILGITRKLVSRSFRPDKAPFMATVEDRAGIRLVALQTPPKRLILYGEGELMQSAIAELVGLFVEDKYDLPGVLGPAPVAKAFQECWVAETRSQSASFMSQRVYVLRETHHEPDVEGQLRLAIPDDINRVKRWYMSFSGTVGERIGLTEASKQALERIKARELYLWDAGIPVSMAMKNRPSRNGIAVSGVYTPPRKRRKGYATACVAALSRLLLKSEYKFCSLFTDLANPTSNSIYQKIGYRPVADFTVYDFQ
jgi:predicted GNAT family acetyltransferase